MEGSRGTRKVNTEVLVIDQDGMEDLRQCHCALHSMVQRSNSLLKHAETLEERIKSDTEILEYTRHELSINQIGLHWGKQALLSELKHFMHDMVTGLHHDVFVCLSQLLDEHRGPVTGTQLRECTETFCTNNGLEEVLLRDENDLTILSAIHDLAEAGLIIRGGPDHSPELRGKYWTSLKDLEKEIEEERTTLEKAGTFYMKSAFKPNLPDNVTVLRPRENNE